MPLYSTDQVIRGVWLCSISRGAPDPLWGYFSSFKNHSWKKKHDPVPPQGSEPGTSSFKCFFFLNAEFAQCSEHSPCTDDLTQTAVSGLCLQGPATLASRLVAREAEHDGVDGGRTRKDCRGQGRTVEDKEEKSGSSSAVSSLCVAGQTTLPFCARSQ